MGTILTRYALSIGAAALIAACGSQPPISAPATGVPNSRADGIPHSSTASSYQVLYRFNGHANGRGPVGGLIDVKGTLYGATDGGGTPHCHRFDAGCGTIFNITTSGVHHVVYSFDPSQSGAYPKSGLIDVHGTLYGTTSRGGISGGTVYTISKSGTETPLYSFRGGSDGADPEAPLLDVNGTLYGTTAGGGVNKHGYHGTVYSISASGAHTVLYEFKQSPDASSPTAGLIDVNGTLYGTTANGGTVSSNCPSGCGTVYSVTRSGVEKVLYRFTDSPDGAHPTGSLLKVNGMLYGTTGGGGTGTCYARYTAACGTVYSITTSGQEKVLYSFSGGYDGENPQAGVINVNGTLYGTTFEGGSASGCASYGCGTVFSLTTAGVETVVYRFANFTDGWAPLSPLIYVNGTLYATSAGGKARYCCGTVFALTL